MSGTLFLCPVPIGDGLPAEALAKIVTDTLVPIRDFIVENEKSAAKVLSRILSIEAMREIRMTRLDEHSRIEEVPAMLAALIEGRDTALLSEAGSPCIADPGALLVQAAHKGGIRVVPLPGPVSLMMALMGSGLSGQRFSFVGYIPPDSPGRTKALRDLETASRRDGSTRIFIETPYRSDAMLASAVQTLADDTVFCIASGLMSREERIISQTIRLWKNTKHTIGKTPTVFLLAGSCLIPGNHGSPSSQGKNRR